MLIEKADMLDALLEQLKQSGARVNAEGFCDTAEQIEEDIEAMMRGMTSARWRNER